MLSAPGERINGIPFSLHSGLLTHVATYEWKLRDPSFSLFVTIQTTYYDNNRTLQCNCNVQLIRIHK